MYELCALLRQPKVKKPRKPARPRICIGSKCYVWGRACVVMEKLNHITIQGRWVSVNDCWSVLDQETSEVTWATRSAIEVVKEWKTA
jgi:hypothetical protein